MIIWDDQVLELIDSKVETYAICGKFKSLKDDFVWRLIGVYGPNDNNLRFVLFDELKFFVSMGHSLVSRRRFQCCKISL